MIHWKNFKYLRTGWKAVIKPRPRLLYKYHVINANLEKLLEKNSLWACPASQLNDPYDCDFELTQEFIKTKYFDQVTLDQMEVKDISSEKFEEIKSGVVKAFTNEMLSTMHNSYKNGMGVCCFTTNPKSELMWSHYGNSGKGICLQFTFRNNFQLEKKIIPISYSDKRIVVKNEINRFNALFHKRAAWKYEKEWRILNDPGTISFNKSDLIGIIFGPKTSFEEISLIKNLCAKHQYQLKFQLCEYQKSGLMAICN